MSAPEGGPPAGAPGPDEQLSPEQEQMLRQMEEQMRNVRVEDLLVQSVVSILNLAARRIVKEDERDLEQARLGIDAVAALVDLLDPEAQHEIKNALSQVQMLYAQHAGDSGAPQGPTETPADPAPGIQKPPSGLWTPGQG